MKHTDNIRIEFRNHEFDEERYDEALELIGRICNIGDIICGTEMTAGNLIKLLRVLNHNPHRPFFSLSFVPLFYSDEEIMEVANVLSETPKLHNLYVGDAQDYARDTMVAFVQKLVDSPHEILDINCRFVSLTDEEKAHFESISFEDPDKWSRGIRFRGYHHVIWGPAKKMKKNKK